MTKRIAVESEVKHGQTYWQIVDYDDKCVIAELGCSPDSESWAEEIVKRWDAYKPPQETGPGDDDEPDCLELLTGATRSERMAVIHNAEMKREAKERDLEEARGK